MAAAGRWDAQMVRASRRGALAVATVVAVLCTTLVSAPSAARPGSGPGVVTRVNVASDGPEADAGAGIDGETTRALSVSGDGRFVAFSSRATNLDARATDGRQHVFLRDRARGVTTVLDLDADGRVGNGDATDPTVSDDGRYVAFRSTASLDASGLASPDGWKAYVRDRTTRSTLLIAEYESQPGTVGGAEWVRLAADGNSAVLATTDPNVAGTADDRGRRPQIVVWARGTSRLALVSATPAGAPSAGRASQPAIAADGSAVAFVSDASDLVDGVAPRDGGTAVYLRRLPEGPTTLVSATSESPDTAAPGRASLAAGTAVARSGNVVLFLSDASPDLLDPDARGDGAGNPPTPDVFVRDLDTGVTRLVSNIAGTSRTCASEGVLGASLVPDASGVVFSSACGALTAQPGGDGINVYYRPLGGEPRAVSLTAAGERAGAPPAGEEQALPAVSGSGRVVVFESGDGTLVADDRNGVSDVFAADLPAPDAPNRARDLGPVATLDELLTRCPSGTVGDGTTLDAVGRGTITGGDGRPDVRIRTDFESDFLLLDTVDPPVLAYLVRVDVGPEGSHGYLWDFRPAGSTAAGLGPFVGFGAPLDVVACRAGAAAGPATTTITLEPASGTVTPGTPVGVTLRAARTGTAGPVTATVAVSGTTTITSVSPAADGWTCSVAAGQQAAQCDHPDPVPAGEAAPDVALSLTAPVGVQEPCDEADPSGAACVSVAAWSGTADERPETPVRAQLRVVGSYLRVDSGDPGPLTPGQEVAYALDVFDAADRPPTATALPSPMIEITPAGTGMPYAGFSSDDRRWSCPATADASGAVRCRYDGPLGGGEHLPALTVRFRAPTEPAADCPAATPRCTKLTVSWTDGAGHGVVVRRVTSALAAADAAPDATVGLTHRAPVPAGGGTTFSIAASNRGAGPTQGPTVAELTLPAGLTATDAAGEGWACEVQPTVRCSYDQPIAAGVAAPPVRVTVSVDPAATDGTASVTVTTSADADHDNDRATDDVAIVPAASDGSGPASIGVALVGARTLAPGETASLTGVVRNLGADATDGPVTVTVVLPAGAGSGQVIGGEAAGEGWTCRRGRLTGRTLLRCRSAAAVPGGGTAPGLVLTITGARVDSGGTVSIGQLASWSAGGRLQSSSGSTEIRLVPPAPARLEVGLRAPELAVGGADGVATVSIRNAGTGPAPGPVSVDVPLPAGVTASAGGEGWTCTGPTGIRCTRASALGAGEVAPPIDVTLSAGDDAPAAVRITATATTTDGYGDRRAQASGLAPVQDTRVAVLGVDRRVAPADPDQPAGIAYTLLARNSGTAAAGGDLEIVDRLPAGATATAVGQGWSCSSPPGELRCRIPAAQLDRGQLAAGASAPALQVQLTLPGDSSGSPQLLNATVGASNATSRAVPFAEATIPTVVTVAPPPKPAPDVRVGTTYSPTALTRGKPFTVTLAVGNAGTALRKGTVAVADLLPAGVTFVSATGTGWQCEATAAVSAGAAAAASAPPTSVTGHPAVVCLRPGGLPAGFEAPPLQLNLAVTESAAATLVNVTGVIDQAGGQKPTTGAELLALVERKGAASLEQPAGSDTLTVRAVHADAGPDQAVDARLPDSDGNLHPVNVRLDGSRSTGAGRALAYQWEQIAGPTVTWAGANAPSTAPPPASQAVGMGFTAPDATGHDLVTLRFRLTVSDGDATSSDEVAIDLRPTENRPPVIAQLSSGGTDGSVPAAGALIDVVAAGADPDGDTVTWSFEVVAPTSSQPSLVTDASDPTHVSYAWPAGIHQVVVQATATDSLGAVTTRTVAAGVAPPPLTLTLDTGLTGGLQTPTLTAGAPAGENLTIKSRYTGAAPPELTWAWRQGGSPGDPRLDLSTLPSDRGDAITLRMPVTYKTGQSVTLEATITRGSGAEAVTATATATIPLRPAVPPLPSIKQAPVLTAAKGQTLTLDADVIGGKRPYSYSWRQVYGPAGTFSDPQVERPSFTVPASDTIVGIELTVRDANGGVVPTLAAIKVGSPFDGGGGGVSCSDVTSLVSKVYDAIGQGKRPAFTVGSASIDLGTVVVTGPCTDGRQLTFSGATFSLAQGAFTGTGLSGTLSGSQVCFTAGTITTPPSWKLAPTSIGATPICVNANSTPAITGSLHWATFPFVAVPAAAVDTPATDVTFGAQGLSLHSTAHLKKGGDLVLDATVSSTGGVTGTASGTGVVVFGRPLTFTGTVSAPAGGPVAASLVASLAGPVPLAPGASLHDVSLTWDATALSVAAAVDVGPRLTLDVTGRVDDADTWMFTGTGRSTSSWTPLPSLELRNLDFTAAVKSAAGAVTFDVQAAVAGSWSPSTRVSVSELALRLSNASPPASCPMLPAGAVFLTASGRARLTIFGAPVDATADACVAPSGGAWNLAARLLGSWTPVAGSDLSLESVGVNVAGDATGITLRGFASARFRTLRLTTTFALLGSGTLVVDAAGQTSGGVLGPLPNGHVILATDHVTAYDTGDASIGGVLELPQGITVVGGFLLPSDLTSFLGGKLQVQVTAAVVISATLTPTDVTFKAQIRLGPSGIGLFAVCPQAPCTDPDTTTSLALTSFFLKLSVSGRIGVGGDASLHLPANNSLSPPTPATDLGLHAELVLDIPASTVVLALSMTTADGGWQNALGIAGLNLGHIAIQGGINFAAPIPVPTVGVAATVNALPAAWANTLGLDASRPEPMTLVLNISQTNPIFQLTLGRHDGQAFLKPLRAVVPSRADLLAVDDAGLVIAPLGGTVGPYTYAPGLNLSFHATILDDPIELEAVVNPSAPTINAHARIGVIPMNGYVIKDAVLDFSVDVNGLLARVSGKIALPVGGPDLGADVKVQVTTAGTASLDLTASANRWRVSNAVGFDNIALHGSATLASLGASPVFTIDASADAVAAGAVFHASGDAVFAAGTLSRLSLRAEGGRLHVGPAARGVTIDGDGCDTFPGTADDGPCIKVGYDRAQTPPVAGTLAGRISANGAVTTVTGTFDGTGISLAGSVDLGSRGQVAVGGRIYGGPALAGVTAPAAGGQLVQVGQGDFRVAGLAKVNLPIAGFTTSFDFTAGGFGGQLFATGSGQVNVLGSTIAGTVSFARQGAVITATFAGDGNLVLSGRTVAAVHAQGGDGGLAVSGTLTVPGVTAAVSGTIAGPAGGQPASYDLSGTVNLAVLGTTSAAALRLRPSGLEFRLDLTASRFAATLTGTAAADGTLCGSAVTSFGVSGKAANGTVTYCNRGPTAGLGVSVRVGAFTFVGTVNGAAYDLTATLGPRRSTFEAFSPSPEHPLSSLGVQIDYSVTAHLTNSAYAASGSGTATGFSGSWKYFVGSGWRWVRDPLASIGLTIDSDVPRACATPSLLGFTRTFCL